MIKLVRVDNRLVHGQVLVTWVPHLGAKRLVVADDDAAGSTLARAAMSMALPPGLAASVERVADVRWSALASAPETVLVLVRDVADLERARAAGLSPSAVPLLNLGNVHFGQGRRKVTPSVFLSQEELDTLRRLAASGFGIEARAVPLDPVVGLEEIERRWAAGH